MAGVSCAARFDAADSRPNRRRVTGGWEQAGGLDCSMPSPDPASSAGCSARRESVAWDAAAIAPASIMAAILARTASGGRPMPRQATSAGALGLWRAHQAITGTEYGQDALRGDPPGRTRLGTARTGGTLTGTWQCARYAFEREQPPTDRLPTCFASKPDSQRPKRSTDPPDVMTLDDLAPYLRGSKESLYEFARGGMGRGRWWRCTCGLTVKQ